MTSRLASSGGVFEPPALEPPAAAADGAAEAGGACALSTPATPATPAEPAGAASNAPDDLELPLLLVQPVARTARAAVMASTAGIDRTWRMAASELCRLPIRSPAGPAGSTRRSRSGHGLPG